MPRTRSQTGLQVYDSTILPTQRKSIAYTQSLNTQPPMDNLPGENMAGNTTTQHESLDRRDNTEPDVSNIELKQFILEMKQEIMNKLAENQHEIREMKDELRAVKTTVSDVEKATSNHAERLDEITQETFPQLKSEVDNKVAELQEKLLLLEIHDRKNNLLIYGVEEKENEDIKSVMLDVWHHNFAVSDEQLERGVVMTACHRLPQSRFARQDEDGKLPPRSVIVRFGYDSDRQFFGNPKNMKRGSKLRVLEDLPPVMKRERGRLASIAYKLRKDQQQMTRIVVKKTTVSLLYKPRNRPDLDWRTYRDT